QRLKGGGREREAGGSQCGGCDRWGVRFSGCGGYDLQFATILGDGPLIGEVGICGKRSDDLSVGGTGSKELFRAINFQGKGVGIVDLKGGRCCGGSQCAPGDLRGG